MEGGPSGFPRGFTCPVVLGYAGQRDQCDFVYRAFTFCGGTFQSLQLSPDFVTLRGSPTSAPQPRIGLRRSGLGYSPFARRYLGNRVFFLFLEVLRCFSSLGSRHATYGFGDGRLGITPAGFPHSGILGSRPACGSPRHIAACHALHRFPAPRHPPFALSSLTTNLPCCYLENIAWLHSRISVFGCQRSERALGSLEPSGRISRVLDRAWWR